MAYPFLINSLTTLILGIAMLMQARRFPGIEFTRDMGRVYLVLAVGPGLYALDVLAGPWPASQQGLLTLTTLACGVTYMVFLMRGVLRLAGRHLSHSKTLGLALVLALVMQVIMVQWGWGYGLIVVGGLTVIAGAVAWAWMHKAPGSARWVGPLLSLMGLVQLALPVLGPQAAQAQVSANTLVRVLLAVVLLHTALKLATQESSRLRAQHALLTSNSREGIAVALAQEVVYCNDAFLKIYGLSSLQEASADWINASIDPNELVQVLALRRQVLAGELPQVCFEGVRRRRDGTPLRLRFTIWRIEWNGQHALQTVITDDTERHDHMAALLHQATHDHLTGLPNRSALLQRLRERCQAATPATQFGLVVLDINRFKLFNDAHGHSLGDEVLKAMAARLARSVVSSGEVCRLGIDGFALLTAPQATPEKTQALAERVREMLAWPLALPGRTLFVDAAIGVALFPASATEAEALLRAANAAMHEAKTVPGTAIVLADARYEQGSGEVLEQEQSLRAGILEREFSLAYQPKVDAVTGALTGFEALARWQRAGVGHVNPMQFIAAAERTGLIGSLGMLLLSQACEQMARWRELDVALVPVAVNVSPLQLLDPGFSRQVDATLKRYAIPASLLSLEITESAAITHLEQTSAQLTQLRELGVQVAMDDFGTGFSSLAMLRNLPLSAVKIDRSVIEPMPAPDAVAVVRAICQLAQALKLRVVAEGVETEGQALAARQAGCHEIQGYFYARPLGAEQALACLRSPNGLRDIKPPTAPHTTVGTESSVA